MQPKSSYFKITLTIPSSLDKVLENLGQEARDKGGYKLPKTLILRSLVRLLMELNVDVTGVKTEEELYERLVQAVKHKHR